MPVATLRSVALLHHRKRASGRLMTPSDIPGVAAWFDPAVAASVVQAGGFVSQLSDLGPNGYHLVQGTGASQPSYSATSYNSGPGIVFSGGQYLLASGILSLSGAAGYAIALCGATSSGGDYNRVFSASNNNSDSATGAMRVYRNISGPSIRADGGTQGVAISFAYDSPFIAMAQRDPSSLVSLRLNGGTEQTGVPSSAQIDYNRFGIGCALTALSGISATDRWIGVVGPLAFINAVLNETAKGMLEGILAWRSGMQGNLSVSHPYKSAPPMVT